MPAETGSMFDTAPEAFTGMLASLRKRKFVGCWTEPGWRRHRARQEWYTEFSFRYKQLKGIEACWLIRNRRARMPARAARKGWLGRDSGTRAGCHGTKAQVVVLATEAGRYGRTSNMKRTVQQCTRGI